MSSQAMEKKFNCYACKHKRSIPGSTHIKCIHPSLGQLPEDPLMNVMATLASVGRGLTPRVSSNELNIRGNPNGIKQGWFNFPWNFDPTWLDNCDGYEPREAATR